jgi:microsomal dipeptidase-like Zn-dependent dipeptidase
MNGSSVSDLEHPKGLTSAFFSATGNRVLTTCNDDYMRIIDISHLSEDKFKGNKFLPHHLIKI